MITETSGAIASIDQDLTGPRNGTQHMDYMSLAKAIIELCTDTGMVATTSILTDTSYHTSIRIDVKDNGRLRLTIYYNWHHILTPVSRVTNAPQGMNKIIKSVGQAIAYSPTPTTDAIVQAILNYVRSNESKYIIESYVDTESSEIWLGMDKIKSKTSIEFIIYQDEN